MSLMICILKAIAMWAVLVFVGMNLIGFIVRGIIWSPPSVEAPTERVEELFRRESRRLSVANATMTTIMAVITVGYLVALAYFWNIVLALAAVVVMASRVPDLIWEIRTGTKISRTNRPNGFVYLAASVVMFANLALVWYSMCRF